MISKFTLADTDTLTLETTSVMPTALTYFFSYAKAGDSNFRRSGGSFNGATATEVIASSGAGASLSTGSFAIQNLNAADATVIIKVGGLEAARCTLQANNIWTEEGVFDEFGRARSVGEKGKEGEEGIPGQDGTGILNHYLSNSYHILSLGEKTFSFPPKMGYPLYNEGSRVRITSTALNEPLNPHYMEGVVTEVSNSIVSVVIDYVVGEGQAVQWYVAITGELGKKGEKGEPGIPGASGNSAETVEALTALPINWASGMIKRLALGADLAPTPAQFENPVSGKAHVIILTNTSGAQRTFTLPTNAAHFTPAIRAIAVANNKCRTLSALYDGTSYHWAVGEEIQNT
jgi:hypothetical protein